MKKYIITIVTVTLVVLIFALGGYYYLTKDDKATTSNQTTQKNDTKPSTRENTKSDNNVENTPSTNGKTPETVTQPTIINGIILANKKHPLPANYNPGENPTVRQKVNKLINDAQALGLNVSNQVSGFRAYETQAGLYNNYVASHGKQEADRFSARPGYSEHQTGLVFDLIDNQGQLLGAEGTNESSKKAAAWLDKNAHKYGFIVRYKPQFVEKTGYMEESWHIRYVGEDVAKIIYEKNISLEEYLNAPGGEYAN